MGKQTTKVTYDHRFRTAGNMDHLAIRERTPPEVYLSSKILGGKSFNTYRAIAGSKTRANNNEARRALVMVKARSINNCPVGDCMARIGRNTITLETVDDTNAPLTARVP
ncbi:hypothetical protein GL2_08510 [Microbulbifer sp. GL-2]|nr:hypothetical protein GL2_08510 [Microbulbifer sp. GL-2]